MATNYIAKLTITCTTLAEYNKMLAEARASPTVSHIKDNPATMVITLTITTTNPTIP